MLYKTIFAVMPPTGQEKSWLSHPKETINDKYFDYFQRGRHIFARDKISFIYFHMCAIFHYITTNIDVELYGFNHHSVLVNLTLESVRSDCLILILSEIVANVTRRCTEINKFCIEILVFFVHIVLDLCLVIMYNVPTRLYISFNCFIMFKSYG